MIPAVPVVPVTPGPAPVIPHVCNSPIARLLNVRPPPTCEGVLDWAVRPHVWYRPAYRRTKRLPPVTATGTGLRAPGPGAAPLPNWPDALLPQQNAGPPRTGGTDEYDAIAQVCAAPATSDVES